jgi:hypothetical protein
VSSARRTLLVAVVAVLGIAVAAAITWGTSQLARQHIGLASEPLSAGRRLLPTSTGTSKHPTTGRTRTTSTTTTPPATTPTTPTTPTTATPSAGAVETPAIQAPARTSPSGRVGGSASPAGAGDGGDSAASLRRDD